MVLICGYGSSSFADSTDISLPASTPQLRIVEKISTEYVSPLFIKYPNQPIYSSTQLQQGSCPKGTVMVASNPPRKYTETVQYYASMVYFTCADLICWIHTVTANKGANFVLNGQSVTRPDSVCDLSHAGRCTESDAKATGICGLDVCQTYAGTWYPVWTYTPDPNGTFLGAYTCVTHGWETSTTVTH